MVRLHGVRERTSEWNAGVALGDALIAGAPVLETSPNYDLNIIVSAQTPGQRSNVSEIDVVVLANFAKPLVGRFEVAGLGPGKVDVAVDSLALTIEVKDHDPSGIRFEGNHVLVKYRDGWHDASDQSLRQRDALRDFLHRNTGRSPYVVNLIWLRGMTAEMISRLALPQPNNILPADVLLELFITKILNLNRPFYNAAQARYVYAASRNDSLEMRSAIDLLTASIEATPLDRRKTEEITRKGLDFGWLHAAGTKEIVLRGRAGTGKTIALLRSAYQWYEQDLRVLLLTYNTALVADLRRQLTILRVTQALASRNIRVMTVHAFAMRCIEVLLETDLTSISADWFDVGYKPLLAELAAFVKTGALSREELTEKIQRNSLDLGWDLICVDEGQDWLDEERDLLQSIYGPHRIIVADGCDQLVRQGSRCNWTIGLDKSTWASFELERCLRMKSGLVSFANALSQLLDIRHWQLSPAGSLPGGRVLIKKGSQIDRPLQERIVAENERAGNRNIDMLYCVTPDEVIGVDTDEASRISTVGRCLSTWGYPVWDAVDREERLRFPTSVDQCRIVQFESSRGLEGWTVILNSLDHFYDIKEKTWYSEWNSPKEHLTDEPEQRELYASCWIMIPVTRAIDTLVITIRDTDSKVGKILLQLGEQMPDIVSILPSDS